MLTLAIILDALIGVSPSSAYFVITEAVVDSRHAIPGSLFVAVVGEQRDGHDYVEEAFNKGAILALVEKEINFQQYDRNAVAVLDLRNPAPAQQLIVKLEGAQLQPPVCLLVQNSLQALQKIARYWRRKLDLKVIGITGSVGKSTTKELVAEVLSQRYYTLKSPGNYNNEIGLPLTLLSLSEGHQRAVLEMGFYVPGEIAFLCDMALPQIGVITNVGTVHAERAGSLENIARGKAELVEALPGDPDGVAILNYDDPIVRQMSEKTSARVFYYGLDPDAHLWADDVVGMGLEGIRFRLHYGDEELHLRVPLIGRHSVHTALRAAAVGLVDGLSWEEIINGLRSETTQLRLVAVRSESGALILDDTYNASPQSTLAALNLLEELEGRKIAVLGDMLELGPYEKQGHEMVGARAAEVVDQLVCMGELSRIIARAAVEAGLPSKVVFQMEDTRQVVEHLKNSLSSKDVVLVKGSRGMRMNQIVASLEVRP
jgi:UDP-N-acetylmuramoyl-tripeptide--D-alanyl-D-alanine ligase